MEIKLIKETKIIGFGTPVIQISNNVSCEEFLTHIQKICGIESWEDVPETVRKNGRETVGKIAGEIVPSDLWEKEDFDAIKVIINEAQNRTKTTTETRTRSI